jgi:hypothetical protein
MPGWAAELCLCFEASNDTVWCGADNDAPTAGADDASGGTDDGTVECI